MGPESDHDALFPAFPGSPDERLNDKTVPYVDTVEEAGCDYSHFTSGKSWRQGRCGLRGYMRTPTWYMPVVSGSAATL